MCESSHENTAPKSFLRRYWKSPRNEIKDNGHIMPSSGKCRKNKLIGFKTL